MPLKPIYTTLGFSPCKSQYWNSLFPNPFSAACKAQSIAAGLADIEGFSHQVVLRAFDRSEGFDLLVTPPTDDRPHGLFTTRSPRRPNPIALTVVELLSRKDTLLHVRGVDMLDGTPILDIKPNLSNIPEGKLRRGWQAEAEAR